MPGASSPIGFEKCVLLELQLARALVHLAHERQARAGDVLGERDRGVVGGLEHQPAQQVGDREPLARAQAQLGLDRRGDVVGRGDLVGQLRLLDGEQRGHQLRRGGDRAALLGRALVDARRRCSPRSGSPTARSARAAPRRPARRSRPGRARRAAPRARGSTGAPGAASAQLDLRARRERLRVEIGVELEDLVQRHVDLHGDARRRVAGLDRVRLRARRFFFALGRRRRLRRRGGALRARRSGICPSSRSRRRRTGPARRPPARAARESARGCVRPSRSMIARGPAEPPGARRSAERPGLARAAARPRRARRRRARPPPASWALAIERDALTSPPARPGANAGARSATEPPCAPIPGSRNGACGISSRMRARCSGAVAPATAPTLGQPGLGPRRAGRGDQRGDPLPQRPARRELGVEEVRGARVRRAHEHEHAGAGGARAVDERRERVAAEQRVLRHRVGAEAGAARRTASRSRRRPPARRRARCRGSRRAWRRRSRAAPARARGRRSPRARASRGSRGARSTRAAA